MPTNSGEILIGMIIAVVGTLSGIFIRGYFANRDKKQDTLDTFKDSTIKDVATLTVKIENLSTGLFKLEGKVEQNTEVLHRHVQLMDHVSRQLKRLFEVSGERAKEKKIVGG